MFKIAISEALYSSKKVEWETPQPIFDFINKGWHFDVDVCALPENAKCDTYYTPEQDGLKQIWRGVCWMNPPYGRDIAKWMRKAYNTAKSNHGTVVALVHARTDTKWWHDYAMKATYIIFIKGRLKFGNAEASCPFPSCFVIFEKGRV
ncbi:DNA N-6-adenine-methyltransferase, partial [Megasphaera sp. SW808]|uniref:DNA N-6-adenine-methyltransferase n=1 Tax=Megasphaera sp. SW808 TaxID=2530045 RepID=UPI003211EF63